MASIMTLSATSTTTSSTSPEALGEQIKALQQKLKFSQLDEKLSKTDNDININFYAAEWEGKEELAPLADDKSFENYLVELGQGKHLDDLLIGTLISFESKRVNRILTFLKDEMKVEKDSLLFHQRELLLCCCKFVKDIEDSDLAYEERKKLKEKSLAEMLENSSYKKLMNNKETKASTILTTSLLFLTNNVSINMADIVDLADSLVDDGDNRTMGRALALISLKSLNGTDDDKEAKMKESAKWAKRAIAKNDFLGYFLYLMTNSEKLTESKSNKFALVKTKEFREVFDCLDVVVEIDMYLRSCTSFMDPVLSFMNNFFCVSRKIRADTLNIIARVLSSGKFGEESEKNAFETICSLLDCDEDNKKDEPVIYLILDILTEGGVDKFIEVYETIYRRKHLPKEVLDVLS